MTLSEIRKNAKESLTNKWGSSALIMLMFYIISFAISIVYVILNYVPVVNFAAYACFIAVLYPISFGLIFSLMELKRGNTVDYTDFLNLGFSNFKRTWCIIGNILKKIWLYILIYFLVTFVGIIVACLLIGFAVVLESVMMLVLGIIVLVLVVAAIITSGVFLYIKLFLYSLSAPIAWDNPEMSAKDVVAKSEALMKGHRGELFLLYLSFIGWNILAVFTLGIGLLWLIPYMETSFIIFYENRLKETGNDTDNKELNKIEAPKPTESADDFEENNNITEVKEEDIEKIDILDDNGNIIK